MPFIPHTDDDVREMLAAIGAGSVEELFDEIPPELRGLPVADALPALNEMEITRLMHERAGRDGSWLSFLGAGAYEHHIPAAVWQIVSRGELYSAYTPYQPEASQGTLQLLYEYQTMMTSLTGLAVTNASLYDGASALAEAMLMAARLHKSAKAIVVPATVHPVWRRVARTIVRNQGIELLEAAYDRDTGQTTPAALEAAARGGDIAAVVVPQANFFGVLEPVDELTDWATARGAYVIALANPVAMALLKPPGEWGGKGADIAVGDGQPLGSPLAGGGPYFGFMACRKDLVRQMPGRIVGATTDVDGRRGFVLTLQAREQHIRRSKATSNICTNQGLMVAAATVHMALLGPEGLGRVARACHANTLALVSRLTAAAGVARVFSGAFFHEAVVRLPSPAAPVLQALKMQGILGGLDLAGEYPELGHALLVCATETKEEGDLARYSGALARILGGGTRPAVRASRSRST
jgi:glycine dehydrogenase subunit 1